MRPIERADGRGIWSWKSFRPSSLSRPMRGYDATISLLTPANSDRLRTWPISIGLSRKAQYAKADQAISRRNEAHQATMTATFCSWLFLKVLLFVSLIFLYDKIQRPECSATAVNLIKSTISHCQSGAMYSSMKYLFLLDAHVSTIGQGTCIF